MAAEQAPVSTPDQLPVDPADAAYQSTEQLGPTYNTMLTGFAESVNRDGVPTAEQFDMARDLAAGLKPGEHGYRTAQGARFVNQEAAETVARIADEGNWKMDGDAETKWRGIADAKHLTEVPDDVRASLGKVDAMEPGSNILRRAQAEANSRLALHDKLKAEDGVREAQADVVRGEKMQAERDRVHAEEHARHMAGAEQGIQDKVNEIMGRIDPNNADAQRLRPSTEAKIRARFEQEAAQEANAKARAAADEREAYINENGGIDQLDRINFQDRIGAGERNNRKADEPEKESDELQRPDNVDFKEWFNTLPKDRPALTAEAQARAEAEAEQARQEAEAARLAAEAEKTGDIVEDEAAEDEAEDNADDEAADEADEVDEAAAEDEIDEDDEDVEELDVDPDSIPWWRETLDRWKRRRNRGEEVDAVEADDADADAEADEADEEDGVVIEEDGTRVLVLDDPSPEGRRRRLGRMMEYFRDPENGNRRRRRAAVGAVVGGVALAGGAALAYYLTKGASGGNGAGSLGTALPFARGTGEHVREAVKQHVEAMKSGSNPWDTIKDYYHSIGVKNPSNAKILKLDELAGRNYFTQHPELGHYSWAAWTRVSEDLQPQNITF